MAVKLDSLDRRIVCAVHPEVSDLPDTVHVGDRQLGVVFIEPDDALDLQERAGAHL